ncbi:Immunoglobulin like fold-containing protein [Desulfonema limicola]|uniref:Immunoglobulin like fold-containing protein n=1 Tax=Desulfonema limicola TaxID=45656 RepID=A0A975GGA1_9BACT|nr:LamG-like jellyroll fold domain-containing protein [Desulfonema limicola]QTA80023.1 Immunoglobulin like fold-containing protein [Desulfonema limicola]
MILIHRFKALMRFLLAGIIIAGFLPSAYGADAPVSYGFESGTISMTTGGDYNWSVDSSIKHTGTYSAAASAALGNNQSSYIQVSVNFPSDGAVSFWYKVSSEAGYDYLKFYIDGSKKNEWSGEKAWANAVYDVSAGTHTFKWEYTKDGSESEGSDRAWIDDISFTSPAAQPTAQAAGLTFTNVSETSASMNWTRGNGANCIVIMKAGTPVDAAPADGAGYEAQAAFGTGTEIGTGNYAVYSGAGTSMTVTGLSPGIKYYAAVYEFNGSSGSQNYLTASPPTANTVFAMPAPGNTLVFDGIDDYVEVPHSDNLMPENAVTVEAWIKADEWGSDSWSNTIAAKDGDPAGGFALRCGADGALSFVIGYHSETISWAWPEALSAPEMNTGQWYHVAGIFNGSQLKVYINGIEKNSKTVSHKISPIDRPLMIGESPGYPGRKFKGMIDEVRIWNLARTQAEIQADMYKTLSGSENGLAAYYVFDHVSGTVLSDLTANNNHGELKNMTGAAWTASGWSSGYPSVISAGISAVNADSAETGGNVINAGASPVTEKGVCWGTAQEPTTADNKIPASEAGTGSFTTSITGLAANTLYYARAYAVSAKGTSYGEEMTFTTLSPEPETAVSGVNFDSSESGSMTISWTGTAAESRLVIVKAGSPVDAFPTDGQVYTEDDSLESEPQLGNGNYIVYSGDSENSVTIEGLTADTVYHTAVYEYNGSETSVNYGPALTSAIGYGASRYYVNANAAQSGSGLSWGEAFKTIQEALKVSYQAEIWVAAGTYYPGTNREDSFYMKNNVALYGGFAGTETELYQRDYKANETVLSGDIGVPDDNSDNIKTIVRAKNSYDENGRAVVIIGDTAVIDGFTITRAYGEHGAMTLSGDPTIKNCTFIQNSGIDSGAVLSGSAKISNCLFINNTASDTGGAIRGWGTTLTGCTFIGNTAGKQGGAVWGIYIKAEGCLFTQNSAAEGGGFNGFGTFTNCTFTGNTADSRGGAINNSHSLKIYYCTIINNKAGSEGGGIYIENPGIIKNTIIANNTGEDIYAVDPPDSSNNIIETSAGSYTPGTGDIIGDQPSLNLGELADNGGPTQTYALLAGSVAINAGKFISDDPKTDQRGRSRFEDRPDIGAYEYFLPPGRALAFDGADDYVEIPNSSALMPSNALTLEAWIKADEWGEKYWSNTIAGKESDPPAGYVLRCGEGGKLSFIVSVNNTWVEAVSDAEMIPGIWYHAAGVFNGSSIKLYINGVEKASQAAAGNLTPGTSPLSMGASPAFDDRMFKGQIDEVRIWNTARTQAQLQTMMIKPLSGIEPGLAAYYTFDEPLGTRLTDITTNAGNGTLMNMSPSMAWFASDAPVGMPVITTTAASDIGYFSAQSGGNITDENGTPVTARGICWSTSPLPTIDNDKTTNDTGMGNFTGLMSPLQIGTLYYARAYASNASGTAYGTLIQFTTIDNAAPVLDTAASPALSAVNEDSGEGTGSAVAEIAGSGITDSDGAPVAAIAVTSVDNTNGVWQYSLDNGVTWNDFSDVREDKADIADKARLLDGTLTGETAQRIRFVPDADWNGTSEITFRAWDKVYGTSGTVEDASEGAAYVGGKGTFSSASDTAAIVVNPVNDAPVLNPEFNAGLVFETRAGVTDNGARVSDIIADGAISDIDNEGEAIAVTSVDNTYGLWQYSLDEGQSWNNFSGQKGSVVNFESTARLLDSENMIRFVLDNPNETVFPSFTFAAWDKSSGIAGGKADVTTGGGSSAFSAARDQSFGTAPVPGLWVGDVELNKVNFVGSKTDTQTPLPAENPFDMRILLHADINSQVNLLRHVTMMQKRFMAANEEGIQEEQVRRVLISDDSLLPNYEGIIRRDGKMVGTRLNSPSFGFDNDKNEWMVQGSIGAGLAVTGTVIHGADHPTNPFKHKFHPDHRTGYEVTRSFTIQFAPFNTDKNPESYLNELEGTYSETIEGIHKIPIHLEGTFFMKRMSAIDTLNDK